MGYPKKPTPEQIRQAELRLAELVRAEAANGRIIRNPVSGLPCCAICKKPFATRHGVWVHYARKHAKRD